MKLLRYILILTLVGNLSCVHTQSHEDVAVQKAETSALTKIQNDSSWFEYAVYRPSQLPLEDFFKQLRRGDYTKAFQQMNLNYRPANYQDQALTELVEEGFIPVYVSVKNTGSKPLTLNEKSFALDFEGSSKKAFYAQHLPKELKRFSPKAVAANAYNTTVVVLGFAAVLAVLVVATPHGNPQLTGADWSGGDSEPIYNNIEKTVRVDYKNFLIKETTLAPGEETKGLLFFHIGDATLPRNAKISFVASNPS